MKNYSVNADGLRRRLVPRWDSSPLQSVLISLPDTVYQARDELVCGLKERLQFYQVMTVGLLVVLTVVLFLLV